MFIIASKGIPAKYGGYETFVENLTFLKKNKNVKYHVSCFGKDEYHFIYNNADCFNVKVPGPGAFGRMLHVVRALDKTYEQIINEGLQNCIVYILGCRVGPFLKKYYYKFNGIGTMIYVNPDGLEWKRDKWNKWQKKVLFYCEKCLVTYSNLVICDSKQIVKDMIALFNVPQEKIKYLSYGADITQSTLENDNSILINWYNKYRIKPFQYYLIIGRFVPENNYEVMIKGFMKSNSKKELVIITNIEKNQFYKDLKEKTKFEEDNRIKFVGTVYEKELIKKIREQAFCYLHGHSVGGTNPSLLEGLASTQLCLLFDVGYNREVAGDNAFYFKKNEYMLAHIIDKIDKMKQEEIDQYSNKSKRITDEYHWDDITKQYESLFLNNIG